ncbi:MAG TPA: HAD hydrolase-like protein [Pseudomonadota bacterium]|nr:HAD hydrolase-like protein [Pseudomonadota bacterium]
MSTDFTVIFDLDGTLVDSSGDIHAALRVALHEVADGRHSHEADQEELRLGAHGLALDGFFRRVRPRGSDAGMRAFVAAYRQHYHSHLLDTTQPFPGVVEGLTRLAQLRARTRHPDGTPRLRLAVATTKLTATARRMVTELGLGEFFDWVQGSDGLRVKPDPQVLHVTLEALGRGAAAPADAGGESGPTREPRWGLMVGDTEFDILAGRAAGMRTCAVAWSEIPRARLLDAAPDHFAESFTHIVELVMAAHRA